MKSSYKESMLAIVIAFYLSLTIVLSLSEFEFFETIATTDITAGLTGMVSAVISLIIGYFIVRIL